MYCVCTTIVAEPPLPSVWSSTVVLIACFGQGLFPVLLVGQSGADLDLNLVRPGICQSCGRSELLGTFLLLSPERLLFVGRASSQTRCLGPVHCCGCSQTGMCGCLPLSLMQESLQVVLALSGVLAHCYACRTTLDGLWPQVSGREWVCKRMWGGVHGCTFCGGSSVGRDLGSMPGWRRHVCNRTQR